MRSGKVVIGYCHPADVAASFHDSLLTLLVHDFNHGRHVVDGGGRITRYSSANISNARNGIARQFLDSTTAEWLWMLDADMSFAPDALERLLASADPKRAPIVGGLCFGVDNGDLFPTLYDLDQRADGQPQMVRYHDWPQDSMFQVAATGAACLLIHRSVLEAMRSANPEPYPWFSEGVLGGQPMGEDIAFCLRAGVAGYPIYVNTGVSLGHAKTYILTEDMYRKNRTEEG